MRRVYAAHRRGAILRRLAAAIGVGAARFALSPARPAILDIATLPQYSAAPL